MSPVSTWLPSLAHLWTDPDHRRTILLAVGSFAVIGLLALLGWWLERRAARYWDEQIARLTGQRAEAERVNRMMGRYWSEL